MSAKIIDGKGLAEKIKADIRIATDALAAAGKRRPGLAVVMVGDSAASEVYVRNKRRSCEQAGIVSSAHDLPATTTESELLDLIHLLNTDSAIDGILVQLPLPSGLDAGPILCAIEPGKDADGLHPSNLGRLLMGEPLVVACTPAGILRMLEHVETPLRGADAVVIGRSNLVGKPVAQLLLARHCTVTMCHSRTRDLGAVVGRADVVVAAVGQPELIRGAWIKQGATVIDVGTNRVEGKLVGDVEFAAAAERARAISPVPGGVGPMTIAMLLSNTVQAARRRALAGAHSPTVR